MSSRSPPPPTLGDLMPSLVQISNQWGCNDDFVKNVAPFLDVNLHHKELRRLIRTGMSPADYSAVCKETGKTRPTKILAKLHGLTKEQCSTLLKKGSEVVEGLHCPANNHRSFVCVQHILDRMTKPVKLISIRHGMDPKTSQVTSRGHVFDVSMATINSALEWSGSLPISDIRCRWCKENHTEGHHVRRCTSCQMTYCKDCRIENLASGGWSDNCGECFTFLASRAIPRLAEETKELEEEVVALQQANDVLKDENMMLKRKLDAMMGD